MGAMKLSTPTPSCYDTFELPNPKSFLTCFIRFQVRHQSKNRPFYQLRVSLDRITRSVYCKFNCSTVKFDKIQHSICLIQISFIIYKHLPK